ncbi:hypothetical protein C2G38_2185123 [Gigaspora rosea]|uniref:Uncharacterized protein n=1 Tax=Gigaspora rosea TaxID=44941 RepID=A0A397VAA3_9GLOM|nr:hypothetical protein C2G38_2185123 [Gigaspora rosea]
MIPLPIDCLVKIFECLEIKVFGLILKPDYESLFSCLLVNRQWCRIIVQILWRQPKFKNTGKIQFDYNLTDGVQNWLSQEEGFTYNEDYILTIANSLIKMILRTSKELKQLVVYDDILNYTGKNALLDSKFWKVFNLCKNSYLTSIDLSDTTIGFEEGKRLADAIYALCKNTTLTSFSLCNNQLGPEVGKAIADALCKNTTLTSLNLCDNQLGPAIGKAIADALCKNATLISLSLNDSQLVLEDKKTLVDAFYKNSNLVSLRFCYSHVGKVENIFLKKSAKSKA